MDSEFCCVYVTQHQQMRQMLAKVISNNFTRCAAKADFIIPNKGLSVIVDSKLHFFGNPRFFCIFRENFTAITYLQNNSLGNSILLERDNSLLLGINFPRNLYTYPLLTFRYCLGSTLRRPKTE